jgi:hypothetical protein
VGLIPFPSRQATIARSPLLLTAFSFLPTLFSSGAEGGTRTRTVSRPRDPKSRAYSNFATPALSPSRRRAISCSLFVATASGRLTLSAACQELLLIRRNGTPGFIK